jgi:inner membrane protein
MMKRSHFLIGAATGLVTAKALGAPLSGMALLSGLAGLLPDLDHPTSTTGRLLPAWWHRLTPGHRGPTHSLLWCLALAALVDLGQRLIVGPGPPPLVAVAVGAGALAHVLADGLTVQGVPLWWPFSRERLVFLGWFAFPTRSWRELVVVTLVVVAALYWVIR